MHTYILPEGPSAIDVSLICVRGLLARSCVLELQVGHPKACADIQITWLDEIETEDKSC